MKIGVISDTHAGSLDDLPNELVKQLSEVDLIVHAGDFTETEVLEGLKKLAEVKAVCGNMDFGEISQILPQIDTFEVAGKKIGLTHGAGSRHSIAQRVRQMFKNPDIIIFGHSHQSENRTIEGTLMFNPGPARESFGLITIKDKIKAEIIRY